MSPKLPPSTGKPSPTRRSPDGPTRPMPGGPLPTEDGKTLRGPHRRRRIVPSPEQLHERASKVSIPGLEIFADTVVKAKRSQQGRYVVSTKCGDCGHVMPQVLRALEKGTRKKCRCQGGVRNHHDPIRYSLRIRYQAMVQRCVRTTHVSDHNYRGRGIEVHFASTDDFVTWALDEFPVQAASGFGGWDFDRIDNDGHYAKDNLRLVTRAVNHLNRRDSKSSHRKKVEEIIERHPDLTYSFVTLRNLFSQGLTEEQILERHARLNKDVRRRPRSEAPQYHSSQSILNAPGGAVVYPLSHPKHGSTDL